MLQLVKTTGGTQGTPKQCKCGSANFTKFNISWGCLDCGAYVMPELGKTPIEELKENLQKCQDLHVQFKKAIDDLERLVT